MLSAGLLFGQWVVIAWSLGEIVLSPDHIFIGEGMILAGGIDLILRRSGEMVLVQCKQWRTRKVPVNVVREMHGLFSEAYGWLHCIRRARL